MTPDSAKFQFPFHHHVYYLITHYYVIINHHSTTTAMMVITITRDIFDEEQKGQIKIPRNMYYSMYVNIVCMLVGVFFCL